ncbi:Globin [Trinorchestia longiramus]|nr:Globin [Trinorchestia longiramus]
MGAIFSIFSWLFGGSKYPALGPGADTPDKITGLTPREARAVAVSWDLVKPNMADHGVNFFLKFFEAYPDAQRKFRGFQDVPLESLRKDKRLRAHASTVMHAINSVVDSLDDPETLVEILKSVGGNHFKRGIERIHFEHLREVLLKYLKEALWSAFPPAAEDGWQKALTAVNAVIFEAYDRMEK